MLMLLRRSSNATNHHRSPLESRLNVKLRDFKECWVDAIQDMAETSNNMNKGARQTSNKPDRRPTRPVSAPTVGQTFIRRCVLAVLSRM